MTEIHVSVTWVKADGYGHEFAEVTIAPGVLTASGVAIGTHPIPYRVDYELDTGPDFVTTRLLATTRGDGWRRSLDLRRAPNGSWSATTESVGEASLPAPGGELDAVLHALDCDLQMSPLTNTMPVLRHDMLAGGPPRDFVMAWVALPSLAVTRSRQRYEPLGEAAGSGRAIRYRSLDSEFVADLLFDADGLVVDYPRLGRLAR